MNDSGPSTSSMGVYCVPLSESAKDWTWDSVYAARAEGKGARQCGNSLSCYIPPCNNIDLHSNDSNAAALGLTAPQM